MNVRYVILYFLMLACACSISLRDNGLMLISGMACFIYLFMLAYWHKPSNG